MEDSRFRSIRNDNVDPNSPGFHWRNHGRAAMIYFVENSSIVPFYAEMPGVQYLDILVEGGLQFIKQRYYLEENRVEDIEFDDKLRIQRLLVEWLNNKGLRHDIEVGE